MNEEALRLAVRTKAEAYENQIDQLYKDNVFDLSMRFGVDEEKIEQIWDEEAP